MFSKKPATHSLDSDASGTNNRPTNAPDAPASAETTDYLKILVASCKGADSAFLFEMAAQGISPYEAAVTWGERCHNNMQELIKSDEGQTKLNANGGHGVGGNISGVVTLS
jgi:hypothetical protein